MKITDKVLSIPPYISTSWHHISSLQMKGTSLAITLVDGDTIVVPGLSPDTINRIFAMHATLLEQEETPPPRTPAKDPNTTFAQIFVNRLPVGGMPFQFNLGAFDELGNLLQHDVKLAHSPALPPELLQKIASITKIMLPDEAAAFPKAEPHCNCPHCQICRAIAGDAPEPTISAKPQETHIEEHVKDSDLSFQQWEIKPAGNQMYTVTNKLDTHEKYSVYLGEPVGCTCGKPGCEHILAVLRS